MRERESIELAFWNRQELLNLMQERPGSKELKRRASPEPSVLEEEEGKE